LTHRLSREQLGDERAALLGRIVGALEQIAESIPERARGSRDSNVERLMSFAHPPIEDRAPRVITLDGKRGVGKTSLMLTLIEGWYAIRGRRASESDWKPSSSEVLSGSIFLPAVDFDPHPDGLSAYAALIGRLEGVVQRANERAVREPEGDAAVSLKEQWEQLLQRAIIGWGAGAQPANRSLDDWGFDVQEQVLAWNRLAADWRAFVDRVTDRLEQQRLLEKRGLLILPIDDVDMRVSGIKQLLLALRQLHHPRVVYLVSLDMEQATWVLAEELRQEAGVSQHSDARVAPRLEVSATEKLREKIRTLAREVLQKSLPAHLIFRLQGLSDADMATRLFSAPRPSPNGSEITLDQLFHESGLTRELLGMGSAQQEVKLSAYLPRNREMSYREAQEVVLSVHGFAQQEELQTTVPAVRVARMLCELSARSRLAPEGMQWNISRQPGSPATWLVHGAVTLMSAPPSGLTDVPERVHEEHDVLVYSGTRVPADPTLVLVRRIIEVARQQSSDASPPPLILRRETTEVPPDHSFTWRCCGVRRVHGRFIRFPWPAGARSAIAAYIEDPPPEWPLVKPPRLAPTVTQWLDERLPGEAIPGEHNYPNEVGKLVLRLQNAVAAVAARVNVDEPDEKAPQQRARREVAKLIGVLAAPESGLPTWKREALVEAIVKLADGAIEELKDWFDTIERSRQERLQLVAEVERLDLTDEDLQDLLQTKEVWDDTLRLRGSWAKHPADWWWREAHPPLKYVQWSTNAAGVPIFTHLGVEAGLPGVHHFVTAAFAEGLRRPRIAQHFKRTHQNHEPISRVSQGTSANYLVDLWRLCAVEVGANDREDAVTTTETLIKMDEQLVPVYQLQSKAYFEGSIGASLEGTWEVDDLHRVDPPWSRDLLTALLLVASWLRSPPHRRDMPALLTIDGRTLDWPPLPSPSHDERLRAVARWTLEYAEEDRGDLRDRMPSWAILHILAAACKVAREERYIFMNSSPILRAPGDAEGVLTVIRELLSLLKGAPSVDDEKMHAWVQHVFRQVPMMLPPEVRGWWCTGAFGSPAIWTQLPHHSSVGELRLLCALNTKGPETRKRFFEVLGIKDEFQAIGPIASLEELVEEGHLSREQLEEIIHNLQCNP
jgi:hypothetical protein